MAKKAHLGRGLSALIPTDPVTENRVETESDANTRPADIFLEDMGIPLREVPSRNYWNPEKMFHVKP